MVYVGGGGSFLYNLHEDLVGEGHEHRRQMSWLGFVSEWLRKMRCEGVCVCGGGGGGGPCTICMRPWCLRT